MKAINETQQNYTIHSQQGFADVLINNITNEKSLHSNENFKAGAIVSLFAAATVQTVPTYLTVQTGTNEHITLNPTVLQYCNHSCNPNVFFDTTKFQLIALKDINAGDELTFFYPSSEWDMTQSFTCACGSKNCLHTIKGAAHISKEVLANYRLTDFIQSMLATQ